ncbi:MAG: putative phage abortive infection protein [Alphaproteobacteria bacterium]|nr:putative phage abortive infection protein [Alphaproteobacteria bacterium]
MTGGVKSQTRFFGWGILALAVLAIGLVAVFLLYAIQAYPNKLEAGQLGPWGDFFGGTLNPILSTFTVLALLYTIFLQRRELEESSRAIRQQNFEATFFKMLEMHNSILTNIDIHAKGNVFRGRDCFEKFFYLRLDGQFARKTKQYSKNSAHVSPALEEIIQEFWKQALSELGHYYRYLYDLTKFADAYEGNNRFYIKIIRSQLSNHELALLFYNCLSEHGAKMKPLVEKYALLKHLPNDLLLDPSHKALISPTAFGEEVT